MTVHPAVYSCHYNNQGVQHLKNERYRDAVASFGKAVFMAKRLLAVKRSKKTRDNWKQNSCRQRPYCEFAEISAPVQQPLQQIPADEETFWRRNSRSTSGFTFRNPIEICDDLKEAPIYCYLRMSFVVMFNLALSRHLLALSIRNDRIRRENLQKAMKLYQLAYGIHLQQDIEITVAQTIPIVNNLSQIHCALRNDREAAVCCENLLSTLVYIRQCGEDGTINQLDGYYSNVLHLVLRDSQVASAA